MRKVPFTRDLLMRVETAHVWANRTVHPERRVQAARIIKMQGRIIRDRIGRIVPETVPNRTLWDKVRRNGFVLEKMDILDIEDETGQKELLDLIRTLRTDLNVLLVSA